MLQQIDEILSKNVEEVIASPLSLQLLRIYSELYLHGSPPGVCAKSQRMYYNQLKKDYEMNKKVLNKTNVLTFKGLRYIPGIFKDGKLIAGHVHIDSETLTDDQAIKYLKAGVLKESDFKVLPKTAKDEPTLSEIIEKGDFNEMRKAAKKAGFSEKNPSAEDLKLFLTAEIEKGNDDLI